jgi:hypothetical protein
MMKVVRVLFVSGKLELSPERCARPSLSKAHKRSLLKLHDFFFISLMTFRKLENHVRADKSSDSLPSVPLISSHLTPLLWQPISSLDPEILPKYIRPEPFRLFSDFIFGAVIRLLFPRTSPSSFPSRCHVSLSSSKLIRAGCHWPDEVYTSCWESCWDSW